MGEEKARRFINVDAFLIHYNLHRAKQRVIIKNLKVR